MLQKALILKKNICSVAVRNVAKIFTANIFARALNFLTALFVIKRMDVPDYGAFTFGFTVFQLIPQVVDLGLSETTVRFGAEHRDDPGVINAFVSHIFKIRLVTVGIIVLFTFVSMPLIRRLFGGNELVAAFAIGAIGGAMTLLWNFNMSVYQLNEKFTRIAHLNIGYSVLLAATVFLLFHEGLVSYRWILGAYALNTFLISLVAIKPIIRTINLKSKLSADLKKKVLNFGFWLSISTVAWAASRRLDVFFITYFLALRDVGIYGAALQLTAPLQMLAQSVANVLLPRISRYKTKAQFKKFIKYSYMYSFFILGGTATALIVIAPFIFRYLGPKYVNSIDVFRILIYVPVASAFSSLLSYVFLRLNRPDVPSKINVVQGMANIALSLALIPVLRSEGAAVSILAVAVLGLVLHIFFANKAMRLELEY